MDDPSSSFRRSMATEYILKRIKHAILSPNRSFAFKNLHKYTSLETLSIRFDYQDDLPVLPPSLKTIIFLGDYENKKNLNLPEDLEILDIRYFENIDELRLPNNLKILNINCKRKLTRLPKTLELIQNTRNDGGISDENLKLFLRNYKLTYTVIGIRHNTRSIYLQLS